jgi:nucleotide-binding universal stress UspA family protein
MSPSSAVAYASDLGDQEPTRAADAGRVTSGRPLAFYQPAQVRWREWPQPAPPFRRLMLALGPTQFFDHAHRLTAALTRRADLTIDLVCIVDAFHEVFHALNPVLLGDPDSWLDRITDVVQAMATRTRALGVACESQVLVGAPALELVRHVQQSHADLLLLGGHIPGVEPRLSALQWRPLRLGPQSI